ncbi:hypothetical protein D3C83_73310 [compost metagenome]
MPTVVSSGLGSCTKRSSREIEGRTLSEIESWSLIWGTTVMTRPTGTVFAVVVIDCTTLVCACEVCELTLK